MTSFSKTNKGDLPSPSFFNGNTSEGFLTNASTIGSTTEAALFNLLANFENNSSDEYNNCKVHIPEWLNIWCVLITVFILIIICSMLMIVSQIKENRQRQLPPYERYSGAPEYYNELFFDRSQIMVY